MARQAVNYRRFWLLLLLLSSHSIFSQNNDQFWLGGYAGGFQSPNDTTFGVWFLDFATTPPTLSNNQQISTNFDDTNALICNDEGELLFYFNGIDVSDAAGNIIPDGDTLAAYELIGADIHQGAIIIPFPGQAEDYILFHMTDTVYDDIGIQANALYYSVINMGLNNGFGGFKERKISTVIDTIQYGHLSTVKHANGRDWWMFIHENESNSFYKIFIDPTGIQVLEKIEVGTDIRRGLGQAVFSPNGECYAILNGEQPIAPASINIFNVDRCTGDLVFIEEVTVTPTNLTSYGLAVSPNSRFLYASLNTEIHQYDLWASDIAASKIVVGNYDGFQSPVGSDTRFESCQLAPDGKIYLNALGGRKVLHIIHEPDLLGPACNFEQHAISLPVRDGSGLPNFPNYRLGSIPNSTCDTLGPIAFFDTQEESTTVAFTDLSTMNPTTWFWDFADEVNSFEQNPIHEFEKTGTYEVCLKVSNNFGADSTCQMISVIDTPTKEVEEAETINIFPNPTNGIFTVESKAVLQGISIHDGTSKFLFSSLDRTIDLTNFPSGIYLVKVETRNEMTIWKRIIKQ